MSQRGPAPYMDAFDGLLPVEAMPGGAVALLGSCERDNQVELGACIDDPANAAKNSVHFSECSKSVYVNRRKARGLREQFLVSHGCNSPDLMPHWRGRTFSLHFSSTRNTQNCLCTDMTLGGCAASCAASIQLPRFRHRITSLSEASATNSDTTSHKCSESNIQFVGVLSRQSGPPRLTPHSSRRAAGRSNSTGAA